MQVGSGGKRKRPAKDKLTPVLVERLEETGVGVIPDPTVEGRPRQGDLQYIDSMVSSLLALANIMLSWG